MRFMGKGTTRWGEGDASPGFQRSVGETPLHNVLVVVDVSVPSVE
jgi:hypothetical protein